MWAVTGPGQLRPGVRLQPNGLKQLLRRRGRAAHVPRCHAHRFRHTFATWAIQQDARELDVQHLLGHAGPEMVRRYTASYRDRERAGLDSWAMATRLVASEIDLTAGPTRASMLSMDPQERELDALIGLDFAALRGRG